MSPMMIDAGWSETYVIGYEAMDTQHEDLFHLCESIFASKTDVEIAQKFDAFKRNMKWHFNQEDILMNFIDYPGMEDHMKLHDDLARRLNAMSITSAHDFPVLVAFVRECMVSHVKDHDMKIAAFRNAYIHQIETQPAPLYAMG